jgi:hypothetical protein
VRNPGVIVASFSAGGGAEEAVTRLAGPGAGATMAA